MAFVLTDRQFRQMKKGDWAWVEIGDSSGKSDLFYLDLNEDPVDENGQLVIAFSVPVEKSQTYYTKDVWLKVWSEKPTDKERKDWM